jgi:hypothetical protein
VNPFSGITTKTLAALSSIPSSKSSEECFLFSSFLREWVGMGMGNEQ